MVNWYQPQLQAGVKLRPTDVMVCVPAKSGTTWSMNIVYQLFKRGDPDFKDIYAEIPWPEFKEGPNQTDQELLDRWEAMPNPRAFKTHSHPNTCPGGFVEFREDVKYLVVFRNPEEAIVSFRPFIIAHSDKLWDHWDCPEMKEKMCKDTFQEFWDDLVLKGFPNMPPEIVPPGGLMTMFFWGFINGWWPLRNKKNVLMLHFNDMKSDHEGSVRKIADFLEIEPSAEEWEKILEYTSFKWMKEHQSKFEVHTLLPFPLLNEGGMVRRGASGKARDDGMTPAIAQQIKEMVEKFVEDPEAREWLYKGDGATTKTKSKKGCAIC